LVFSTKKNLFIYIYIYFFTRYIFEVKEKKENTKDKKSKASKEKTHKKVIVRLQVISYSCLLCILSFYITEDVCKNGIDHFTHQGSPKLYVICNGFNFLVFNGLPNNISHAIWNIIKLKVQQYVYKCFSILKILCKIIWKPIVKIVKISIVKWHFPFG
jgi:hypothetical protein